MGMDETSKIAQTLKLASGVRAGLAILSERFLVLVGIAANCGVFMAVVLDPSWPKVVAGALFSVAVYALVHGGAWITQRKEWPTD